MKKLSQAPYTMLALALLGIAVAFYDAYSIHNGQALWCPPPINGCNEVASSPYARIFDLPVGYYGVIYYLYMIGLAALLAFDPLSRGLRLAALGYTALGACFSIYFMYLQFGFIHAFCIYCFVSAVTTLVLFIAALSHFRMASVKFTPSAVQGSMMKRATLPILTLIILLSPLQGIAQQTPPSVPQPPQWYWPGPWHMWGDGYGFGWQFWWICPLMMLFMFLVFGVIFFFVRRSWAEGPHHWGPPSQMMDWAAGSRRHWSDPTHSALQLLNERFAKGEIQKDEYQEKKAAILSGGQL